MTIWSGPFRPYEYWADIAEVDLFRESWTDAAQEFDVRAPLPANWQHKFHEMLNAGFDTYRLISLIPRAMSRPGIKNRWHYFVGIARYEWKKRNGAQARSNPHRPRTHFDQFECITAYEAREMARNSTQCLWHRSCKNPRRKGHTHCDDHAKILESWGTK